jgi:hypothetical protein
MTSVMQPSSIGGPNYQIATADIDNALAKLSAIVGDEKL